MNSLLYKMLDALTSAYSRKDYKNLKSGLPIETNIGKLFSLFDWGLHLVQEQADLIKLWDDLDYAQGSVLDRYGANFGVARGGASDPLYRLFIKVKMIAQLSGGDEDTVIKAAAEFLGVEYSDIDSEDVWPAKKWLYVDFKLLSEERLELIEQIAQAIKRTIAAGVGFRLYLRTYRTFVMPLPIHHGGVIGENLFMQPVGQDRLDISPLPVSRTTELSAKFSSGIAPGEHIFSEAVTMAQGGVLRQNLYGCMPDHKITTRGPQRGVSGAICLSHIKSRRIV